MSGRRPNETALELWIDAYLKKLSKTFNRRSEAKFIEKSIMMINIIFGQPCCSDPENVITLITPNDNTLTHTVRQLLQKDKIVRRDYRLSLFRILNRLNNVLYGECCDGSLTITYEGVAPSGVTAQFFDVISGDVIFSTTTIGGIVQQASIPAKYFGAAALIGVQLTILSSPSSPNTYQITDGVNVYVNTAALGTTTSSILLPLQPNYIINTI